MYLCLFFFFFFSSRRRHTRCGRDWSSDVCSSDLFARAVELRRGRRSPSGPHADRASPRCLRSEEHTSELQSRPHLVFRLLLEKKKPPTTRRQAQKTKKKKKHTYKQAK